MKYILRFAEQKASLTQRYEQERIGMKKLVAIGILAFEIYLIISFSRSVWELWQNQDEVEKAKVKVETLRSENNKLKSELEYAKSEEFLEREARDKLHFVKSDETVVVIPDAVMRAATASAAPTPPPPKWEQWMKLFF